MLVTVVVILLVSLREDVCNLCYTLMTRRVMVMKAMIALLLQLLFRSCTSGVLFKFVQVMHVLRSDLCSSFRSFFFSFPVLTILVSLIPHFCPWLEATRISDKTLLPRKRTTRRLLNSMRDVHEVRLLKKTDSRITSKSLRQSVSHRLSFFSSASYGRSALFEKMS